MIKNDEDYLIRRTYTNYGGSGMCEYCNTDYKILNKTKKYSDIEISLYTAIKGIRVRANFDDKGLFGTQDVVVINYCPMCGRKLGE